MNQPRKHRLLPPKRVLALLLAVVLLTLCAIAPTLLSQSGLAANLLSTSLSTHRLEVKTSSIQLSWTNPTRVSGLSVTSVAGDQILVEELTCDLSLLSYLTWTADQPLTIYARQVSLKTNLEDGEVTLIGEIERINSDQSTDTEFSVDIKIEELNLMLHDRSTEENWHVHKANADASYNQELHTVAIEGVLTDPQDQTGSFKLNAELSAFEPSETTDEGQMISPWMIDVETDSLPMTFMNLLTPHITKDPNKLPEFRAGDTTGRLRIKHHKAGKSEISFNDLQLRQYMVNDFLTTEWSQRLTKVNGSLWILSDRLTTNKLSIATDFGNAVFDGQTLLLLTNPMDEPTLSEFITTTDGTATIDVHLPSLSQSLPDVLPLSSGAELHSGRAHGTIGSTQTANGVEITLKCSLDDFEASTNSGDTISLAPNRFDVTLEQTQNTIFIHNMKWESEFGAATGTGDLRQGNADFSINLSKIAESLTQIFDLQESSLQGTAQGSIAWITTEESEWSLDGSFSANDVTIDIGNAPQFNQTEAFGEVHSKGRWSDEGIEQINTLEMRYQCDDFSFQCDLDEPTQWKSPSNHLDLVWAVSGQLASLQNFTQLYPELDLDAIDGRYRADGKANLSRDNFIIPECSINLSDALIAVENTYFRQPLIQIMLNGDYSWKTKGWKIHDLTLSSHCMSARASGQKNGDVINYEIQWRVLIDRLFSSASSEESPKTSRVPVNQTENTPQQFITLFTSFPMYGDAEGSVIVKHAPNESQYEIDFAVKDFAIPYQKSAPNKDSGNINSQNQPLNLTTNTGVTGDRRWIEPEFRAIAVLRQFNNDQTITIDRLDLSTNWIKSSLKGTIQRRDGQRLIELAGQNEWDNRLLSQRLKSLAPFELQLNGKHISQMSIDAVLTDQEVKSWTIETNLVWDSASIAGIALQSASIPFVANQERISFEETNLQAGDGRLTIAGLIYQANNQTWIELTPTSIAERVNISPEMSTQWLRYITPVLADATEITGRLGIKLNEARINIDDPMQTRIRGQVEFDEVRLVAGTLINQLIQTTQRLKTASLNPGSSTNSKDPSTLVKIPTQAVDFTVANKITAHERFRLDIDRAQLLTTGQVDFDGNLGLTAMLPLDPRWLGQDLQRLSGQTLNLPISGTLERPYLDGSNLQSIITQIGVQVIQDNAENFIEEQINRSLNKLFGN